MAKKESEIVEILEAFDLTRCVWSAARLAGCDPKTVQRYVDRRDAGRDPFQRSHRTRVVDPFLEKIEELVERSRGKIRADVVHRRLVAMGFSPKFPDAFEFSMNLSGLPYVAIRST